MTPAEPTPIASPPARSIRWSGMTDRGRFRKNNEDAFLALTFDGRTVQYLGKTGAAGFAQADFVFAVSDGMGGANLGEYASRLAVEKIAKLLPRSFRLSAGGMSSGFQDILGEVFASIHDELSNLGRSYEECSGMGATLSLGWFTPEWMFFGHVGDSRIYYLPKAGALAQVSHDHTQVGWLRRQGRLNEREARTHPGRSSLQQALGAGHQFLDPHIGAVGLNPGDRFLICSDGIVDGIWDRRLGELLGAETPADALAPALVREAVENSGRDNTTAVVIEILGNGAA